jgi:hypothetical protein
MLRSISVQEARGGQNRHITPPFKRSLPLSLLLPLYYYLSSYITLILLPMP